MWHRKVAVAAGSGRRESAKSQRTTPLLTCFVLLALLSGGATFARADSQVRAVRLSNVSGSVQILSGTETEFQQAYPNMPLTEGSRLQAGDDGRAEIQFEDGSVARLTPNSSLNLAQLRRDGSGSIVNSIELVAGLAYFETGSDHHQQYTVQFGNVQISPSKGAIFRVNLDASPAELAVLHGSVHLSGGSAYSVEVRENESVHFDANDESRYYLAEGVTGDSWDEWNSDRDQALAAMSSEETREARMNAGGAGWSDLDYYGNWYAMPGYGNVWSPYGMNAGWDPYGSGYWGFYGGAGYQWISGYPWGWLPYRCGSWNYFDNYGWGWAPVGCGNSWGLGNNYYGSGGIVIGSQPRGYRLPQRPVRPHPVAPGANLPSRTPNLIAVNRGADASRLDPRPIGIRPPQRVVQVGGRPVAPLPKSLNATPQGPAGVVQRAGAVPVGSTGAVNSHVPYVPVMRPYAGPVAPSANAYTPRPASSYQPSANAGQFHGGPSAPSFRSSGPGPSAPSHMSSAPSASSGVSAHSGASVNTGGGSRK